MFALLVVVGATAEAQVPDSLKVQAPKSAVSNE